MTLAEDIKALREITARLAIDYHRIDSGFVRRTLMRALDEISEATDALELIDLVEPVLRKCPRHDLSDYEPGH